MSRFLYRDFFGPTGSYTTGTLCLFFYVFLRGLRRRYGGCEIVDLGPGISDR